MLIITSQIEATWLWSNVDAGTGEWKHNQCINTEAQLHKHLLFTPFSPEITMNSHFAPFQISHTESPGHVLQPPSPPPNKELVAHTRSWNQAKPDSLCPTLVLLQEILTAHYSSPHHHATIKSSKEWVTAGGPSARRDANPGSSAFVPVAQPHKELKERQATTILTPLS